MCIVFDVTERAALQARLIESQKMESLGRLAGGIAHDFNNILGGILGYASLMRETAPADSDFSRYALAIEGAASRAAELTQQLLAFARGKKAEVQEVNLNAVIDETLSLLSLAVDPNIELRFDRTRELYPAKVDLSQINQLLMNLLINARDAIEDRGRIYIATANVDVDEAMTADQINGSNNNVMVFTPRPIPMVWPTVVYVVDSTANIRVDSERVHPTIPSSPKHGDRPREQPRRPRPRRRRAHETTYYDEVFM